MAKESSLYVAKDGVIRVSARKDTSAPNKVEPGDKLKLNYSEGQYPSDCIFSFTGWTGSSKQLIKKSGYKKIKRKPENREEYNLRAILKLERHPDQEIGGSEALVIDWYSFISWLNTSKLDKYHGVLTNPEMSTQDKI